jgi:hypothetical protein
MSRIRTFGGALLAGAAAVALAACGDATSAQATRPAGVPPALAQAPASDGNFALFFGGTGRDDVDRVKIPVDSPATAADVGATDMTLELWLRAEPGDNPAGPADCGAADAWIYGNIVLDRDRFGQGRKFGMSIAGGVVVFGLTGAGADSRSAPAVSLCGTTRVDDGRWHHVALTRSAGSGQVALYVDGRPDAGAAGPAGDVSYPDNAQPQPACDGGQPCTRSDPFLVIGAEKHDAGPDYPSFRGSVDELRLSTVVRYSGPFAPPGRFAPDQDTAGLYHFDEGTGTVAATDPPGSANGTLIVGGAGPGPAWVASTAPTGR